MAPGVTRKVDEHVDVQRADSDGLDLPAPPHPVECLVG